MMTFISLDEALKDTAEYEIGFNYGVTKTQLHRISNRPKNEHNWFTLESWTPEQAVCLFYDVNPYEYEKIKNHEDIQWLLLKAKEHESQSPQEWKQFAIKNQIPIPNAFNYIPIFGRLFIGGEDDTCAFNCIPNIESTSNENDKNPPSQTPPLSATQPDKPLTKLEKQHKAIIDVITLKKFDPMQIPDGEKGTIHTICEHDYPLLFDAESSFITAWKKGRHLFKMAHHEGYARRGKK